MDKKVERTELITHLEHLAEYVKYSEDAPALREAIALLKTHEERTETHACDLIQPDHNAEVSKKVGDDLIRRHGVSAWLYNLGYPKLADIVMNEQRFPPAQPEQRWIPCSEMMPVSDGIYIVDDYRHGKHWIHTVGYMKRSNSWCEQHGIYYDDKYGRYDKQEDIIAWMPLPEPYKERWEDG